MPIVQHIRDVVRVRGHALVKHILFKLLGGAVNLAAGPVALGVC